MIAPLTFSDQKNGVCGEVISLALSGYPNICPILSVIHHITHLRANSVPPITPIARVFHHTNSQSKSKVTPAAITKQLCQAVQFLGPNLDFLPLDVLDQSLYAAGATALLVTQVEIGISFNSLAVGTQMECSITSIFNQPPLWPTKLGALIPNQLVP